MCEFRMHCLVAVWPWAGGKKTWQKFARAANALSYVLGKYWTEENLRQSKPKKILLQPSHFRRVRLCATPSLGFSRHEHWSGLPFPSPMHKSEKWKWSRSVLSDSSRPHGLQPSRLLRPWDFPGKRTGVGAIAFSEINTSYYYY